MPDLNCIQADQIHLVFLLESQKFVFTWSLAVAVVVPEIQLVGLVLAVAVAVQHMELCL
jgi:hypothetical protein